MKFLKILSLSYTLAISLSTYLHSQTIVPAGLGQMSVAQPTRETAVLTGNLLRTGGQNPTVKILWVMRIGELLPHLPSHGIMRSSFPPIRHQVAFLPPSLFPTLTKFTTFDPWSPMQVVLQ